MNIHIGNRYYLNLSRYSGKDAVCDDEIKDDGIHILYRTITGVDSSVYIYCFHQCNYKIVREILFEKSDAGVCLLYTYNSTVPGLKVAIDNQDFCLYDRSCIYFQSLSPAFSITPEENNQFPFSIILIHLDECYFIKHAHSSILRHLKFLNSSPVINLGYLHQFSMSILAMGFLKTLERILPDIYIRYSSPAHASISLQTKIDIVTIKDKIRNHFWSFHPRSQITVKKIEKDFRFKKYKRDFELIYGITLADYIRELKVHLAIKRISPEAVKSGHLPHIAEIAGFESVGEMKNAIKEFGYNCELYYGK